MLLAIDIGNTSVGLGVFREDDLVATLRAVSRTHQSADDYAALLLTLLPTRGINPTDINSAVISSVVPPLTPIFDEVCRNYFQTVPLIVEPGVRTGVRISTDNPKEVGADRIVNAAAGHTLYGGPLIVIDFGTATTIDAVSEEGDYLGGAIAPGVEIALEALYARAAKLPRIELTTPETAIGKNTVDAMQSGVIYGYVGLVEGLVARIRKELPGTAYVVATGGLSQVISQHTSIIDTVNPNLTLHGLRMIHHRSEDRHIQGRRL